MANDLPHPRPKAAHVCDPPGVCESSLKCCIGNDIIVPTLGNPHLLPITRHLFIGWYNSIWHITAAADAASTVASLVEPSSGMKLRKQEGGTHILLAPHINPLCVFVCVCHFVNFVIQADSKITMRFRVSACFSQCLCAAYASPHVRS